MTFPALDALIGRVKRSAVDAYFASFEYWRVKDNKYIYGYNWDEFGDERGLTAPNEQGEGGFEIIGPDDHLHYLEFIEKSKQIMAHVDDVLGRWRSLPEPTDLDNAKQLCGEVYGYLANQIILGDTEEQGKTPVVEGKISAQLQKANNIAETQLSGSGMYSFKNNFLFRMQDIMNNLCGVSRVVETALVVEQGAIKSVREGVLEIATQARESFAAAASQPHEELTPANIRIVVAGAAAIGTIASGGTAWVVGAGLVALAAGAIADAMEVKVEPAPEGFSAVMTNMEMALKEANKQLKGIEETIHYNLATNDLKMSTNKQNFDLDYPIVHHEDVDQTDRRGATNSRNTELRIGEISAVREITDRTFPSVASMMNALAEIVGGFKVPIRRADGVGYGDSGPMSDFYAINDRLIGLIRDLAEDIELGAHTLNVVLDSYEDIDYQSAKEMDSKMTEYETQASASDPWQRKK